MTKVCDYCADGVPVVCRWDCGWGTPDWPEGFSDHDFYWSHRLADGSRSAPSHPFSPIHRIPDPEGIEGTQVVPCGLA